MPVRIVGARLAISRMAAGVGCAGGCACASCANIHARNRAITRDPTVPRKKARGESLPAGFDVLSAPSASQKSKFSPILKNRAWSTLVGRSQVAAAVFENVLLTVKGQLLLKML